MMNIYIAKSTEGSLIHCLKVNNCKKQFLAKAYPIYPKCRGSTGTGNEKSNILQLSLEQEYRGNLLMGTSVPVTTV